MPMQELQQLLLVRSYKMEYTYEVNEDGTIMRRDGLGNTACIPNDPANSDYQAYLDRDNSKAALSTPNV